MGKLMYALFVMMDGFSIGAALFGAYAGCRILFQQKLRSRLTRMAQRRYRYLVGAFAGYAITATILLARVVIDSSGELPADMIVWAYNAGLAITGIGFAGLASVITDEVAFREIEAEQ